MSTEPRSAGGIVGGMVVSGLIATAVALVVTFILSFLMPFPWDLSRTMLCVAVASFSGSAVSFQRGYSHRGSDR
jgi:hypothetical protein